MVKLANSAAFFHPVIDTPKLKITVQNNAAREAQHPVKRTNLMLLDCLK